MAPPRPDRLARFEPLLAALISVGGGLLMVRWVLGDLAGMAVGAQRSEAPRHFWGLWAAADGLSTWGPLVAHLDADFPTGHTVHLMDPINLLFFLPGFWALGSSLQGAILGWNLAHFAWPVLGGLGGWLLARDLVGREPENAPARLFSALACATGPYLLSTPWLGRTEYLPATLWALHLWALRRALGPKRSAAALVGAGLSLAAIALGGWYLAGWLALFEPAAALVLAASRKQEPGAPGWGALLGRLAAIAVIAVLPVLPALQALLAHPPPILAGSGFEGAPAGVCTPPWSLLPFTGSEGLPGVELPGYAGTVLTGMALLGAVLDPRARPWLGIGLAMLTLGLGPYLVWSHAPGACAPGALPLPALAVETLIPPMASIWGWGRIACLSTAPLALAGALALRRLSPRLGDLKVQLLVLLLVGMAVDHGRPRAPAGIAGARFDPRPPTELTDALGRLPKGALLELPFDNFYMTWQLSHRRPVSESLEIEWARTHSVLAQQVEAIQYAPEDSPGLTDAMLAAEGLACLRQDSGDLRALGYSALLLHREGAPARHAEITRLLATALGPPAVDGDSLVAWILPEGPAGPRLNCPLVEVDPTPGDPAEKWRTH